MFMGTLSNILTSNQIIFSSSELKLIKSRIEASVKSLISNTDLSTGLPKWKYIIKENENNIKYNNLIQHCYTIWGLECYREYKNSIFNIITWTKEKSVLSIEKFIEENIILEFSDQPKPARLWATGMLLALASKSSNLGVYYSVLNTINNDYGPFPNLIFYPNNHSNDNTFYPRHAAQVLWGLALGITR